MTVNSCVNCNMSQGKVHRWNEWLQHASRSLEWKKCAYFAQAGLGSWDHFQAVVVLQHLDDQLEPPSSLVDLMEQVAAPWAAKNHISFEAATSNKFNAVFKISCCHCHWSYLVQENAEKLSYTASQPRSRLQSSSMWKLQTSYCFRYFYFNKCNPFSVDTDDTCGQMDRHDFQLSCMMN